jgi:antitoxin ChpS
MDVILRKYGNSTVAVIPPPVLRDIGIAAGQTMTLDTTADGKIILTRKHKYTLAELMAQCDLTAPRAPDPWDDAPPVGGEVL